MTLWLLIVVIVVDGMAYMQNGGLHATIEDCFEAREVTLSTAPKPKINYEAICIQTDQAGEI